MKRIFPMLVCVLMLLQSLFLFAPAASAVGADAMDASYVVDDLNKMGVDITKYKADAENDRMELLSFTEFGYKVNGDFSEYGLYLYLWNPSGVKLEDSDLNCIQLSYGLNAGGKSGYRKYGLEILSWSTGSGYEYVFYKMKIKDSRYIAQKLNKASRTYEFSGVEILRKGNSHATDYKLGGAFTFTGYHEGCNSSGFSTLWVDAVKFDTVELELHPVTYYSEKTINNSKRQVYDEIFGVYFSVPKAVIKRYGDFSEENLKGLYSVKGCYREVTTNGILTDSSTLTELFQNSDISKEDIYFRCKNVGTVDGDNYFRVTDNCTKYLSKSDFVAETIPEFLYSNVFKKGKTINGVSASEFAKWYTASGKNALTRSALKNYTVTKDDIAKAEEFVGFWKAIGNFFKRKGSTETVSFNALQRISALEAGALNVSAVSETFKVTEADAEELKSFVLKDGNDYTYVMHFAVRECESDKITDAGTLNRKAWFNHFDKIKDIGNSYYFEKTVFEDFDILELTFRDEENKMSVVPVSASPIDVTGGIPSPGADNPNEKPKADNPTDWWTLFNSLETWIKVVAVLAVFVLLFLAFRFFGGFFGFVGRIVTAPFRLLGKGISTGVRAGQSLHEGRLERKAQREHDEDRERQKTVDAQMDADRERRQKYEDEDRARRKIVDSMSDADRERRQKYEDEDRARRKTVNSMSDSDRERRQKHEDEDRKRRRTLDKQHDADRERRLSREIEDRADRKRRADKQEAKNDIRFGLEMSDRAARSEKRDRENVRNAYEGKFENAPHTYEGNFETKN